MFICSDSLETHSFLYDLKHSDIVKESSFQLVKDFEFSPQERNLSSSYRELLSVVKFTENYVPVNKEADSLIYWLTDSKNLFLS